MKQRKPSIHLGEEVFLTLSRGFSLARKAAENMVEPMGVTLAEYNALRIVENDRRVTATHLKKRLQATAPTVAHLVANLERKKMIRRVDDKHDKRMQHISLTKEGRSFLRKAKKKIAAFTETLPLKDDVLRSAIKSVAEIVDALSPSPS